jgi:hypothetical protein
MSRIPIVFLDARKRSVTYEPVDRDALTLEDQLPVPLETDTSGRMMLRETRVTEIRQETTDDD